MANVVLRIVPGRQTTFRVLSVVLWSISVCVPGQCTAHSKANILVTVTSPVSSPSHHMVSSTISGGLVASGYNVTLLTDAVRGTEGYPNGTLSHALHFEVSHQKSDVTEALQNVQRSVMTAGPIEFLKLTSRMMDMMYSSCSDLWRDQRLLQQLRASNFTLVVVSAMSPSCEVLLARYLDVPFVVVIPSIRIPFFHEGAVGMPYPSAYVPFNVFTTFTEEMTFFQRVANLVFPVMNDAVVYLSQRPYRAIQQEHSIDPDKSIMELYSKASLVMAQLSPANEYPRPYTPNFITIGALLSKPPKPLPKELDTFVQGSGDHGVIIFTMGSALKGVESSAELAETFARVFSQLSQRVLWRHNTQNPPRGLGENTKISDWLPQNDLLGHPKTRLLIYHGGSNGVHESVYHGVPMVVMPIAGDQFTHAARVQRKGMGLMLDKNNITEDTLMEVIQEVLNNPKYKERTGHFSRILRDAPMTPLKRAVYWIEHVIKFGDKHLRPRSADMGVIELYMLDVTAFLVMLAMIGLYVDYVILRKLYSCCCKRRHEGTRGRKKPKNE